MTTVRRAADMSDDVYEQMKRLKSLEDSADAAKQQAASTRAASRASVSRGREAEAASTLIEIFSRESFPIPIYKAGKLTDNPFTGRGVVCKNQRISGWTVAKDIPGREGLILTEEGRFLRAATKRPGDSNEGGRYKGLPKRVVFLVGKDPVVEGLFDDAWDLARVALDSIRSHQRILDNS
jgi:hypothetical protein